MTKAEMIGFMAEAAEISKKAAGLALDAVVQAVKDSVVQDGRVEIPGLGVFKQVTRAACERPNPQKRGEKVQIAEHQTVRFKPAPTFKEAVNG